MARGIIPEQSSDCKLIPLTQGQCAIVDAQDYLELSKYRWYAMLRKGYWIAVRNIRRDNGKRHLCYMHRWIMKAPSNKSVDHINHATLDNRRSNLRLCSPTENAYNSYSHKDSSSQYKGVSWCAFTGKWRVQIRVGDHAIHGGRYDSEQQAATAYDLLAAEHQGAFACYNIERRNEQR